MEIKNRAKRALMLKNLQRQMQQRSSMPAQNPVRPMSHSDNSLKGIDINRKRNIAKNKKGGF